MTHQARRMMNRRVGGVTKAAAAMTAKVISAQTMVMATVSCQMRPLPLGGGCLGAEPPEDSGGAVVHGGEEAGR